MKLINPHKILFGFNFLTIGISLLILYITVMLFLNGESLSPHKPLLGYRIGSGVVTKVLLLVFCFSWVPNIFAVLFNRKTSFESTKIHTVIKTINRYIVIFGMSLSIVAVLFLAIFQKEL